MAKYPLRVVVTFLLASALAACGGHGNGAGTIPATPQSVSNATGPSSVQTGPQAPSLLSNSVDTQMSSINAVPSSSNTATSYKAINAGGTATGSWGSDTGYSAGSVAVVSSAIDVSKVASPAPQEVYRSQRYAPKLTYAIPGLTPNSAQTVRLHFVESYFTAPGKRIFDVSINGSQVLTSLDIFRAAGGKKNVAVVKEFSTYADASGKVTIQMSATVNSASIAGIELIGTAVPTPMLAINSGGYVTGNWVADTDYVGGSTGGFTNVINTSHVTDPAPQAVYDRQRSGPSFEYVIPRLTAGGAYTLRLHFAEPYFTVPGQRVFNVTINGTRVLTNFDIVESAGGKDIGLIEQFDAKADSGGRITIGLAAVFGNATIAGIEVLNGASAPTPVPLPTSTAGAPSQRTPGFGPRVAVGPQATITCPSNSIKIKPGADAQKVVEANAAGKTYCLTAGTFAQQEIVPKSGDTFIGAKGAILDGKNTTVYAFYGSATNVTIENLVVMHYNSPAQRAAIAPQSGGTGWVIKNNEIAYNAAAGVGGESGAKIVANYIHQNNQEGYTIQGSNVVVTDNEIADNNPNDAFTQYTESGGGKAWATTNANISYNYSHDNHGAGLWTDTDNQGTVYEYNDLMNNWGSGISHEISWDATIQHNFLKYNANATYCGGEDILTLSCSEIRISDSGGVSGKTVDVSYNTVIPNSLNASIGLANSNKGSGLYGIRKVQNVHVHNNIVNLSAGGVIGAVDEGQDDTPALFASQGNSLDYDTYTEADNTAFYWKGSKESFSALRSQGQELHGTSH